MVVKDLLLLLSPTAFIEVRESVLGDQLFIGKAMDCLPDIQIRPIFQLIATERNGEPCQLITLRSQSIR